MHRSSHRLSQRIVPAALALASATAVSLTVSPAQAWWWRYDPPQEEPCPDDTPTEVPELSGSGLGGAAVLVLGGLVLVTGKRRRRS